MTWDTESGQATGIKSICQMLNDLGIVQVNISYDGSGDDGSVSDIEFVNSNDEVSGAPILNEEMIRSTLDDAAYALLSEQGFDWVNNEGGYGVIRIYTEATTYKIEHNQRITDTEYNEYDGDL